MQEEAEEPSIETTVDKPTRAEILLVGAAWTLFLIALLGGLRAWSGGSH
jgi:hypothetical protein